MQNQDKTILVVDDDLELCELVKDYLETEDFVVDLVHRGEDAAERAVSGSYGLIILDVMLPGINGLEVLRQIRSKSEIPVLMLTARGEEVDRIVGLEVGADDYLPKPFNPRELIARMRAILRRAYPPEGLTASAEEVSSLKVGDVELEGRSRVVLREGEPVLLTAVEFDLLALLLQEAGSVLKREDLVQRILGRDLSPFDRSIDMHVSKLRRKLGPHQDGSDRIKSIRSVGYIYTVLRNQSE